MSTVKFLHLKVGQQFEFRGDHYTKIAPLIASNDADGKQKMIPRSALVTVLQASAPSPSKPRDQGAHPALEVLERYHQTVLAELQLLEESGEKVGAARARLDSLKKELVDTIENQSTE